MPGRVVVVGTARSVTPSPLKSPATGAPASPFPRPRVAVEKLPPPVLVKTDTELEAVLLTARSSRPSLLKSPIAIDPAPDPMVKFRGAWNEPPPVLRSTLTEPGSDA